MSNTQGVFRRRYINSNGKEEQKSILSLATMRSANFTLDNCPEFLDIIFWMKYLLGLIFGFIWGFIPITGTFGLIAGLTIVEFIPAIYGTYFLKANSDDFPFSTLLSENLMPSVAFFILIWVLTFTVCQSFF